MLSNRLAIASVSLGQHESHTLPMKIVAAAEAGIDGIEVTWPDLEGYAKGTDRDVLDAATEICSICKRRGIRIIALASFQNFEGQKTSLEGRLATARRWLDVASRLGAIHLQIPSNFDGSSSGDREVIIPELRQLSDLAKSYVPVIKIAYENLAWGTHCYLWQHALQIVQAVDRRNFGLCLDSFHLCVSLWADCYRADGRQPNGFDRLHQSLLKLVRELPLDRLFYLQLSDGEILDPPYSESHPWFDANLAPGHVWSNEARPFPLESALGGYMPVQEIAEAFLVKLGFSGWVSLETFDRRMRAKDHGPQSSAHRAIRSWRRLSNALADPMQGTAAKL